MAAAGGGARRWQECLGPNVRTLVRQQMVTKLAGMFKDSQRFNNLQKIQSFAAKVEESAFNSAQTKEEYMKRIGLNILSVHKRALQASAENSKQQQMRQMQLGGPVQGAQGGGTSLLAMARQATSSSAMASPAVQQPFQQPQPHMTRPNMQIRHSNTVMAVANKNANPQSATFATMAPTGIQSGRQQIMQSVPMQSQNRLQAQAVQPQHHPTSLGSYNLASVAQLQGQPVVRSNAQPNHLLNHNVRGAYGVRQPSMQLIRNQQGLGVNQHHMDTQWHRMVGANNSRANLSAGYPGGSSSQQSVGCAAGLSSSLQACKQEALKQRIDMETQLTTPACGPVTINQPGNAHFTSLQTPATTSPGQTVDWRDKMFQQILSWKAAYISELLELNRTFVIPKITKEQFQSLPKQKAEDYQRKLHVKNTITGVLNFLQIEKNKIPDTWKEMLSTYDATIHKLLAYHRKTKANTTIGSNIGRKSQDYHGKPESINFGDYPAPFSGGKSSHSQQSQSKQPADASFSQIGQDVVAEAAPVNTKGSNIGKESQDHHEKPQTIILIGDSAPFSGGKSSDSKQSQSNQPTDPSASRMRQSVVTDTQPFHLKTDSSDPQGVRRPCSSVTSPGGLQSSPNSYVELFCMTPPIGKSELVADLVDDASPFGSRSFLLESLIAEPRGVVPDAPCASEESSWKFFIQEKSMIPATASPCSSVESTLLSTAAKSAMGPGASPCHLVESTAPDGTTNCHQATPSELTVPASLGPAQEAASQTEDVVSDTVNTPVAKKPIDRLIDAIRASSPEVLRWSVNSMKSAIAAMDAVPTYKMKRTHDVISSYSEPPYPDSLDISGAACCKDRAAKRQKTQNVLLGEIEAINSKLIDTTVSILGGNPADEATSCYDGTLIKLKYTGVSLALTPGMQGLVKPATVFVPADYPASSLTLIRDEGEEQLRKNFSSISEVVDAAFRRALSELPEPWLLKEVARAWDSCVRRAVMDSVQQHTGGALFAGSSFSRWESCVGAA